MPVQRPCISCGVLTPGTTRCPRCAAAHQAKTSKRRGTTTARGYGSLWQIKAKALIATQPWCSNCGSESDLTVDHIVPRVAGGGDEVSNLQVLCRRCNSAKAGR